MKHSIAHLPKRKQDDLHYLIRKILERIPQTQMIILYGSYATGKYVEYDERVEFGIRTSYMSDYDLLVVTHGARDKEVGQKLDNIEEIYYKDPDLQTPVQFINEDIKALNKFLSEGRYFYTQIKKEGVLLYDNKKCKLARRRKLNYEEIHKQAEEYFEEKFKEANEFLVDAHNAYNRGNYKRTSFYLHQTCENLFYAVRLVYTLQNNKQHNLSKLLASVRKYSPEFEEIFPRQTKEQKNLFNLLKAAYVEARYNPQFIVTKEDIETLMVKVEALFSLVKKLCRQRIEEYMQMDE
ncbi:MAG: HEPN domain-containing protein [Bacteroides sp.]|nr:HEPN domain-containing protein [Bacteroides sp.]